MNADDALAHAARTSQSRPGPSSTTRILLLAPYPPQSVPGQRFRFEQYIGHLSNRGIILETSSLLDSSTNSVLLKPGRVMRKTVAVMGGAVRRLVDLARARRYDGVFIYREAFPFGYPVIEHVLGSLGLPYLLDFDDAIYLPASGAATGANRFVAPLKYPRKTRLLVKRAKVVTVGNDHLATWARRYARDVRVIPTTIDTERYLWAAPGLRGPPLTLGWSGSKTTIQHLDLVAPVLRRLQTDLGVQLLVIGDNDYAIKGANVETIAWRESSELEDLQRIDIGIMPLPDDDWARGKCGLKALQYMALGIPTVMSPVGVNTDIAQGGAALLARTHGEWYARLRELVESPALRGELARAGRVRVEERYSVRGTVDDYEDALRFLTSRG